MTPSPLPPARRFEGRTAIVTGAGSGIGRATAERLAAEGAAVACLDVAGDAVNDSAAAIAAAGGRAVAYRCDVSDETSVGDTVAAAAAALGRPQVLCNVAGIGGFFHTVDMPKDRWDRMIAVNLTGQFLMARATLPHLLDGGGAIVNVASTAGVVGSAYSAAYCASKGGVIMLTKALAMEYVEQGVRVNAVVPGQVDTPLIAEFGLPEGGEFKHLFKIMSKMGSTGPEQIAAAIAFLASDESSYTTASVLAVDGGITA